MLMIVLGVVGAVLDLVMRYRHEGGAMSWSWAYAGVGAVLLLQEWWMRRALARTPWDEPRPASRVSEAGSR